MAKVIYGGKTYNIDDEKAREYSSYQEKAKNLSSWNDAIKSNDVTRRGR